MESFSASSSPLLYESIYNATQQVSMDRYIIIVVYLFMMTFVY